MLQRTMLQQLLPSCCELDSFPIARCSPSEQETLKSFFPEGKTVIVLAHHVKSSIEWMWFPLESERGLANCAADLHIQLQCDKVAHFLEQESFKAVMPPYPCRCGLRFKDMANKTGLGSMGDNFLFLHREWGPWTHLRVMITDAEITDNLPSCENVCVHCGACRSLCPAGVIKEDTLLGAECDEYQDSRHNKTGLQDSYLFKCEVCVRACPIGKAPQNINISKG
jgi:epoxyqueuosine reductase QueG